MRDDTSEDVLRFCLRSDWAATDSVELKTILSRDVDWGATQKLLGYHKLAVAFYHMLLTKRLENLVPRDVLRTFRAQYVGSILHEALRQRELNEILTSFAERVPVIPLKGSFLSDRFYSVEGLRPAGDIDLFVREADLPTAITVLKETGYRIIEHSEDSFAFPWRTAYPAVCAVKSCVVELHWYFPAKKWFGHCGLDMAAIWDSSSVASLDGAPVYEMSCEHLLLYLCLHLAVHHQFACLLWFRDIGELVRARREEIDWEYFSALAARHKAAASVYFSLKICRDLGLPSCPAWVLGRLRPRHMTGLLFEHVADPASFVRVDCLRSRVVLGAWPLVRDERRERVLALVKWPASVVQTAFRKSLFGQYVRGTRMWVGLRRVANRVLVPGDTASQSGVGAR